MSGISFKFFLQYKYFNKIFINSNNRLQFPIESKNDHVYKDVEYLVLNKMTYNWADVRAKSKFLIRCIV